ncbi:dTDP-4-dehydrorhamnose 3,5-epimerase family protein [Duncaniella dubosii]|uniref:dTDP-4-dehydrorhamnose 3,5-epimerase family protein n=1 Tax=Duncaniella dubosii TaxID=2518971 RepID=UPI003F6614D2
MRGLHFQRHLSLNPKLVRCVKEAVLDVAVDIRRIADLTASTLPSSCTDENHSSFFIPRGFAHGLQYEPDSRISIQMRQFLCTSGRWRNSILDSSLGIDLAYRTRLMRYFRKRYPTSYACRFRQARLI